MVFWNRERALYLVTLYKLQKYQLCHPEDEYICHFNKHERPNNIIWYCNEYEKYVYRYESYNKEGKYFCPSNWAGCVESTKALEEYVKNHIDKE